MRSGDVTAIRRVSARNDLVETSRHHPLGQYLGPMATFDLNIELAQRGDDAALRAMRLKEFKYEYNVVIWESQIDSNSLHPALGNRGAPLRR